MSIEYESRRCCQRRALLCVFARKPALRFRVSECVACREVVSWEALPTSDTHRDSTGIPRVPDACTGHSALTSLPVSAKGNEYKEDLSLLQKDCKKRELGSALVRRHTGKRIPAVWRSLLHHPSCSPAGEGVFGLCVGFGRTWLHSVPGNARNFSKNINGHRFLASRHFDFPKVS